MGGGEEVVHAAVAMATRAIRITTFGRSNAVLWIDVTLFSLIVNYGQI